MWMEGGIILCPPSLAFAHTDPTPLSTTAPAVCAVSFPPWDSEHLLSSPLSKLLVGSGQPLLLPVLERRSASSVNGAGQCGSDDVS